MAPKRLTRSTLLLFVIGQFITALISWHCVARSDGFACGGELTGSVTVGVAFLMVAIISLLLGWSARDPIAWVFWGLIAASYAVSSASQFIHRGSPVNYSEGFLAVRDTIAFLVFLGLFFFHRRVDFDLWPRTFGDQTSER